MNLKKFFVSLLMGMFLLGSIPVSVSGESSVLFKDVNLSQLNYSAIKFLKDEGVVQGYADGNYKPGNQINRAEFLKIAMMAGGITVGGENCYPDVKKEWYAEFVCAATKAGLVKGYPDGKFKPEQSINFAEASKIIANTLKLKLGEKGNDWYDEYVKALEDQKAIPKTVSSFNYNLTRGEMAEVIWRIKEKVETEDSITANVIEKRQLASESGGKLQSFSSCVDLKDYLEDSSVSNRNIYMMKAEDAVTSAPVAETSAGESDGLVSGADDYSSTNVQVEGVDEADIVKNDGKYIYLFKNSTVRIVEAYPPASTMKEVGKITFETNFYPSDMYVDGDKLIVIGTAYESVYRILPMSEKMIAPNYGGTVTKAFIYDIKDRSEADLLRTLSFEGDYSSSRKIGDKLYMVMNKYQYYYVMPEWSEDDIIPMYSDTGLSKAEPVVGCADVLFDPWTSSTNYLIVAGVDVSDENSPVSKEVVLGSSNNIYSSVNNLYVAQSNFSYDWWRAYDNTDEKTDIHKFSLGNEIKYLGNGEVPGTILNQFSMDEYNGNFRIATTVGEVWNSETPSKNNLYILDKDMKQVGAVEGIAPGEQIHSVRFMGKKAYIVTFKKIDPFFVIDVADPKNPVILGKLKIPGYSDYLHPYDENHIIGFGKDTANPSEEEMGNGSFDFAWYQGLKIAMFDVTDVANPKELHKVIIGDRGTDSELLWNHKALLFDKEKGIMAFPVRLAEIPESVKNDPNHSASAYGDPVYQGAYVYDVSVEDGFSLRGRISHYAENEIKDKAGYYWYGDADISRILYIGDFFYTVSQAMVKANEMDDLKETAKVDLK